MPSTVSREVGTKNRRLTFEAPSDVVDGSGNATKVWTVVRSVWGKFEGLGGTILGTTAQGDARFTIWYASDITPRWRIGLSGTNRKFVMVTPPQDRDGLKVEMVILAKEILA